MFEIYFLRDDESPFSPFLDSSFMRQDCKRKILEEAQV
jgi:hypothetical protein